MTTSPPAAAAVHVVVNRALRDGGTPCCEVCGDPVHGERGVTWALHHRKGRTGPSTDNSPANLLLVHGASNVDECHGQIHAHRGSSQDNGWMVSRNGILQPAEVAVLVDNGSRYVYLTVDGQYSEVPGVAA